MNKAKLLAALLTGASAMITVPAIAQSAAAAPQQVAFSVDAQDLKTALDQFAQQSDADLVYDPALVRGLMSTEVRGRFAPIRGLERLLTGTGLRIRQVEARVFAIQSATAAVTDPAPTGASAVQGVVTAAANDWALPGARIVIDGTDLVTVADERGRFFFPEVPMTATSVTVEYLGQASASFPLAADADARQQVALKLGDVNAEIVVLGYSSAIQRALNQQLRADNSATIVSSDLLGSFPAETVSEALRRLPGVAFGRSDETGEGERITVRGFSSEAINIQLNGLDLQGTGFERTIDLSGFLAENISQVTIQKSLLPSHQASGSGGLVEIETKSGLDYGKFALNFGMEGETGLDRAFGNEYQVNGTLAKKLTDNFGIVATVQYRKTDRTNYGVDIADLIPVVFPTGFNSLTLIPASRKFPFDAALNDRLLLGASYSQRSRDEENLTASLNFAWDVSPSTSLRLDLQRIQRDARNETARTSASYLVTTLNMPVPELNGEVRPRFTISSLRPNLGLNISDQRTTQDSISLRGTTTLDRWRFEYKGGFSRAKSQSDNANLSVLGATSTNVAALVSPDTAVFNRDSTGVQRLVNGAVVFRPNGLPVLSLSPLGSTTLNNLDLYNVSTATRTLTNSPTQAYTAEGSVRYQPAADWFSYIEVGGKYDRSSRKSADDLFATNTVGSLKAVDSFIAISAAPTALSFFGTDLVDSGALEPIGAGSFSAPFLRASAIDTIFAGLANLTTDNPATAFNERRFTRTDRRDFDPILDVGGLIPTRTIEENRAGYVEAKFKLADFELVGGARFESRFRSGRSLTSPSVRTAANILEPRETFVNAGLVAFTELSGTQTTLTPSVIVNYRPRDNLVARFAYFRSTVNPDFRLLRRSRQISIDLRPTINRALVTEANPDLRPTKTDNFDVDLSYYFTDSPGLIRAGFFYKKVSNNFTNVFFQAGSDDDVRQEILTSFGALATARPDLVAFNASTAFERNRPENGAGGDIYGVELEIIRKLNFLPGLLSDFGVLGNFTYTKSRFPTLLAGRNDDGTLGSFTVDRPFEDQAAIVYNASLNYEKDGFEGRLIYTRQSASPTSFEIHGLDTVVPAYATLDLRLSYNFDAFGAGWTVFLQGDDLLRSATDVDVRNAVSSQFNGGDAEFFFPDRYLFNGGRTISAGFRARF